MQTLSFTQSQPAAVEVLVFQTDLESEEEVVRLGVFLNHHRAIRRWSVDLEDVDRVLRIEAEGLAPATVCALVAATGFACAELAP